MFVFLCRGLVSVRNLQISYRDTGEHSALKQSNTAAITASYHQVSAGGRAALAVSMGKWMGLHAEGAFVRVFGAAGVKVFVFLQLTP